MNGRWMPEFTNTQTISGCSQITSEGKRDI
jgi:hypothetical protein